MKIEKPDWYKLTHSKVYPFEVLDQWFQENVEPVNKMLEDAVEMVGDAEDFSCGSWIRRNGQVSTDRTHKALLINIQEIKPKTREERAIELLGEIIAEHDRFPHSLRGNTIQKAKQILEGENGTD